MTGTRWTYAFTTLVSGLCASLACSAVSVTTHHMDGFRTGWNPQETALTAANVNSSRLSQTAVLSLDAQVDAQPLVLANQTVNGTVYASVVYVVTENNTVYAIDGAAGTVITSVSLEAPFASSNLPQPCHNNSDLIGIDSTPVIDASAGTLYVVTATPGTGTILHWLHALSTNTLADKSSRIQLAPPAGITYSRQRSALALFNGGVLVPFSSFCDTDSTTSRGHLIFASFSGGPQQVSLQTSVYSLASIWMSGGGPAVYGNKIYITTGNQTTNNLPTGPPSTNVPDSFVMLTGSPSPFSLSFSGYYTPDTNILYNNLDKDFGAGSVLIVPSGAPPSITSSTSAQFVTGAGKTGVLYLVNPSLGYIQGVNIGGACFCGTSYFTGADGNGHVVTSAGTTLGLYTVSPSGVTPATSTSLPAKTYGDPGTITTISSNGTASGTGVIWTVSGPDAFANLTLYAYNASNLSLLYSSTSAGYWSYTTANSNTSPVVANGHVYVTSNRDLTIWTLSSGPLPAVSGKATLVNNCPAVDVSWSAVSGATSYNLYSASSSTSTYVVPGRILKYSGSATTTSLFPVRPAYNYYTVAACNQYGCSDPGPVSGGYSKACIN